MSKTYRWVSPLSWTLLGAALATAGTTVTRQPAEARQRRMLRLAP